MVVRGRRPAAKSATRKPVVKAKTATPVRSRKVAAKPAAKAASKSTGPDVTAYATKEPTGYHKAFAKWIIEECGVDLTGMSARKAFLTGVSISTAARAVFQKSDFLAQWREETGEAKRGPKTADEKRRATREVVSDDEFEDEGDETEETDEEGLVTEEREEELSELSAAELRKILKTDHGVPLADYRGKSEEDLIGMILDLEFPDESDEDEDEDEDDDFEDEDSDNDEDVEDEEEEETPPARSVKRTAKPVRGKPAAKGRPASKSKATADDDEDLW